MKVGLFGARADDRGLGRVTHDFYRHMRPDRTLVIDMGQWARRYPQHLDRYPGAAVTPFNGGRLDDAVMCRFFTGLDVAVMYETAYDHRAYDIARAAGCRTVLMTMPEFHRHLTESLPHPDVVWAPTVWRLDTLPGARVVPVPVAAPPPQRAGRAGVLRVLHVGGHRTSGDRNGTLSFLRSLRQVTGDVTVKVTSQDRIPAVQGLRHIPITHTGPVEDHWQLYDRADVLVMPRRYGGLCLPVQEALACGLGVVMTGCSPNPETWPIDPVDWKPGALLATPGGKITLADPDLADLSGVITRLAQHPAEVDRLQASARAWAAEHSWDALEPLYRSELALVLEPAVAA